MKVLKKAWKGKHMNTDTYIDTYNLLEAIQELNRSREREKKESGGGGDKKLYRRF
jgi:hypothetical protein